VLLDEIEKRKGVILNHGGLVVQGLRDLVDPAAHDIALVVDDELLAGDEGGRGDDGFAVDDLLFEVSLDLLDFLGIGDFAEYTGSICTVHVDVGIDVLCEAVCDDDGLLSGVGQLLYGEVDQAAQRRLIGLEELGDGEEDDGGLLRGEIVALTNEVQQTDEDLLAAMVVELQIVEDAAFLQHGALFNALEGGGDNSSSFILARARSSDTMAMVDWARNAVREWGYAGGHDAPRTIGHGRGPLRR